MTDDAGMLYDCFHAFNRLLHDAWGFSPRDHICAPPYIPMLDVDRTVAELEWALGQGANVITVRPRPAYGRSPADPYFDPFWARVNERRVTTWGGTLTERPSDIFRRHVWVSPFREEDIATLVNSIGVDQVLMGSDWPHGGHTATGRLCRRTPRPRRCEHPTDHARQRTRARPGRFFVTEDVEPSETGPARAWGC